MPRQRLRGLVAVTGALVGAGVALALWSGGALDRVERTTIDTRFDMRGARAAPTEVVVVGIDDDTLADLGLRWPFPRDLQARALNRIAAAEPRAIGYDIQLSEPGDDPAADQAIGEAVFAAGPLVLATTRHEPPPGNGPNLMFYDEDLASAGIRVGHAGFPDTPDSVFRTVPGQVEGLPSFARAVAEVASGRDLEAVVGRSALIDYAGPPGTVTHLRYSDVLAGRVGARQLRDRIVVVGVTAQRLGDVHPTPFGGAPMSGPEINANAITTILNGVPLSTAHRWLDGLIILLAAAIGAAVALLRRPWLALAAAAAALVGYLALTQLAFQNGTVLAVAAPLLALGGALVAGMAGSFALIERDRARLRAEFARFVPAAVVDEVIARTGDDQRLGGRRIHCTVMFADLRGFTGAAERLPPEMVIEVLNRYLGEMSDAILDAGGTLVSYMGDGIMALFGAPIEQEDHADRAVIAARRMRDVALPSFNGWYRTRMPDDAPFAMGIGLASGPVMSGNVGSERRLEYAAVGDTTNVAARLQALTKDLPHTILVADATRAALHTPMSDLRAVGALDVRGRRAPAAVWALDEGPGEPVSPG